MLDNLFGPLSKESCRYFHFFAVAGFILMIVFILFTLVALIRFHKKMDTRKVINLFTMIVNSFLLYFSNRLLYTMCMKVL
jgi:energy-coupling factor transporter transmembrane protein EcfT